MYFKGNHSIYIFFQEADLGLGPVALSLQRTEVIDFSASYMNSETHFFYKAIDKVQPDLLIVWKTFTVLVRIYWYSNVMIKY